jgi:DNA-binding GntR family transcriptional regulator
MIKYFERRDEAKLKELMKAHIEVAASDALKSLESAEWEKDV